MASSAFCVTPPTATPWSFRYQRHNEPFTFSGKGAYLKTVSANDAEAPVRLSPADAVELDAALDDADREEGISAEELFERLRKYG